MIQCIMSFFFSDNMQFLLAFVSLLTFALSLDFNGNLVQLAEHLNATIFVHYLNKTGLIDKFTTNETFTLFVPTDDAFHHLPNNSDFASYQESLKQVLNYHATSGRLYRRQFQDEMLVHSLYRNLRIRINLYQGGNVVTATGSRIHTFDLEATNGVIHLLDRVMYTLPLLGSVAQFLSWPIFRYMYYGMIDGNLTHVLYNDGPITVLLPNDYGFEQLPPEQMDKLMHNGTAIRRMVRNHIFRGTFFTSGMYDGQELTSLEGQTFHVSTKNGNVTVEGADILLPDMACTNGVAQVTAKVFMPPGLV